MSTFYDFLPQESRGCPTVGAVSSTVSSPVSSPVSSFHVVQVSLSHLQEEDQWLLSSIHFSCFWIFVKLFFVHVLMRWAELSQGNKVTKLLVLQPLRANLKSITTTFLESWTMLSVDIVKPLGDTITFKKKNCLELFLWRPGGGDHGRQYQV